MLTTAGRERRVWGKGWVEGQSSTPQPLPSAPAYPQPEVSLVVIGVLSHDPPSASTFALETEAGMWS